MCVQETGEGGSLWRSGCCCHVCGVCCVFTRTPVPRIPVLSEGQTAKDQLERRRCLKRLSRSKPDSTTHQLLIRTATWVLSWRVQSVSHLPGIFSMTLQLSLEERYVQALIYLARAPEEFPQIFGLTPSAFGKWWPHLYVNSGARVGAVSYDTVATGLRV